MSWCTDRQQKHTQLEAALQIAYVLPFATYPVNITLEAEPINTQARGYLRNAALAVLHHLSDVAESPFILPA